MNTDISVLERPLLSDHGLAAEVFADGGSVLERPLLSDHGAQVVRPP